MSVHEQQNQHSNQSLQLSKSPHQLRKEFLNNSLQSSSENSNRHQQNTSNEQQEDSELKNEVNDREAFEIKNIRDPKLWDDIDLNLQSKYTSTMKEARGSPKYNYSESQLDRKQLKKHDSKLQLNSSFVGYSSIEVANYKAMLRKQIEKSKKLEEALHKHDKKNIYMAQLIEKLQQENKLLRKMYEKEKNKNHRFKTLHKEYSQKQIKYCQCDETNPNSLLSDKYKYFKRT